jgi:hypothetical protein
VRGFLKFCSSQRGPLTGVRTAGACTVLLQKTVHVAHLAV